jgi:predicted transposase/invertase (TIGR01784 family)
MSDKKENNQNNKINQDGKSKNYIRFDWAIKRLLRNKADFGAVNGLLSCLFKKQISIINVLESEGNQENEDSKLNRVDVLVEDENGEKIIIEIQNNYQVDYYHRMLFGVSKIATDYIKKGDNYGKIKKIYSVSIVYFELGRGNGYAYHGNTEFRNIDDNNDILELSNAQKKRYEIEKVSDIFPEYYLLRVEKFNVESISETEKKSLDQWLYYLKTTRIPDDFDAQGLDEIREKQRVEDLSEEEKKAYYRHLDQVNYEDGVIEHSRLEGIIEGEKIGIEKGKAEGLAEGEQERLKLQQERLKLQQERLKLQQEIEEKDKDFAKKLKEDNIPIELIVKYTNLTIGEIEKL